MILPEIYNIRKNRAAPKYLKAAGASAGILQRISIGIPRQTTSVKSDRSIVTAQYFHFRPEESFSLTIIVASHACCLRFLHNLSSEDSFAIVLLEIDEGESIFVAQVVRYEVQRLVIFPKSQFYKTAIIGE